MSKRKYVPVYFKTDPKNKRLITLLALYYKKVIVPAYFSSDGLTKLFNKFRIRCLRAAVIHDFICATKCLPRKLGDRYFYEVMRLDGVNKFEARGFWLAVRAYAIVAFKK